MISTTAVNASPRSAVLKRWVESHWDIALLLALAAAVYQPWNATHLPLTDFGMFFSTRGASDSILSQFGGIAGYYIGEGRLCLVTYLYVAVGSVLFGTWAPGWHWSYFLLNAIVLLLGRSLLSRMGLNRTAVFVALGLWAVMGPTAELWVRPAGEPFAMIFFLTALHLALNFSVAEDWRRRATMIAACAVGVVFSKELLVVLLPAGWLLSRLTLDNGEWKWAPWSARDTVLLRNVTVSVAVTMIPVIYVATHASAESYVSLYNASPSSWAPLLNRLEVAIVPSAPRLHWLRGFFSDPAWTLVRTFPNVLWIAVTLICVAAERRRRIGWPVAVGIIWIASGVLAYLPWPKEGMFYMMPFALGTMFIAAHALSRPLSKGNKHRRAAFGVAAFLITVAAVEAHSTINQHRLRANLNAEVIDAITQQGGADLLIAAVPQPSAGSGGWASHLTGFGVAVGMRVDSWRDMTCDDARDALKTTPGVVVVSAASACGKIVEESQVISQSVPRALWPWLWRDYRSEGRMYVARSVSRRRLSDSNRYY